MLFIFSKDIMVYTVFIMVITYQGCQSFKLTKGDTVVAFDPLSKDSKWALQPVRFGADIVLSSMNHRNFNAVSQLQKGQRDPFIINAPGEYEVGEVTVRGFGIPTVYDGEHRYATMFQVKFEGMNILFLGPINSPEIDQKILGALSDIDILFVPIGDGDVLSPPQASKLAVKLEARLTIPMHYDDKALDSFLREEGLKAVSPQEKLTIKQKDISQMSGDVVVLSRGK